MAPNAAASETSNQPPQGVEHLAEVVATPAGVLGPQGRRGGHEIPFGVADVGVVGLAMGRHALNDVAVGPQVRNIL